MLVLNRRKGEKLVFSNGMEITVSKVAKGRVKLAMDLPDDVNVRRGELDAHRDFYDSNVDPSTAAGEVC